MVSLKFKYTVLLAATAAALSLPLQSAKATNGYFQSGYGASSKGLAGAGVALSLDSMAAATNPAAMVHVGNRVDVEVGAFMPDREISGDGTVSSRYESINKLFLVPQFGANYMLDNVSSLGITMSANGGMNTEYESNPFVNFGAGGSTGTEATNAPTGVDLSQALLGITYARKHGNHSFGVTPTLAMQRFKAYGLQGFEGISSSPWHVHGNGYDYSAGYGLRIGYMGKLGEGLTIGAGLASKMYMSRFSKYDGLFADGGSFDIPANLTAGLAYQIPGTMFTVAADYQYIAYGDVDSISNSGAKNFNQECVGEKALGAGSGCGFGWEDQHILKLGIQFSPMDDLLLRTGISHNTQVYENGESLFNIIAPAVVRTHISFGATYSIAEAHSVNLAFTHALEANQTGTHPNQGAGSTTTHTMDQNDVVVGYSFRW
jgi:long-chain fatty acid transport protein